VFYVFLIYYIEKVKITGMLNILDIFLNQLMIQINLYKT